MPEQTRTTYFLKKFNDYIFDNYRKGGIKAFCDKHKLSYNTVRHIASGKVEKYPGIVQEIFDIIIPEEFNKKRVG